MAVQLLEYTSTWGTPNPEAAITALYGQHGGFDMDLVGEEETEEFVCGICSKILRDPHLTICCGQHYCETCLKHWVKKQASFLQKNCPHCRKTSFEHVLDKKTKRKIDVLKVHCVHSEKGCEWEGELCSVEAHLDSGSGCHYVQISCPNNCGLDLIRMDIQAHLSDECELRTCECEHCGYICNCKEISNHHSTCIEYPIPCPDDCKKSIKRKNLYRHKDKCPMGPAECPFAHAGCDKLLKKKDLEKHLKKEVHSHLLLFLGPLERLRLNVTTVSANLSELCAEQLQAKGEVQILRENLEQMNTDIQNLQTIQDKDRYQDGMLFLVLFGWLGLLSLIVYVVYRLL